MRSMILSACVFFFACATPTKQKVPVKQNPAKTGKAASGQQKKTKVTPTFHFYELPQIEDLCEDLGNCPEARRSEKTDLPDPEDQWYDDFYKDFDNH